MSGGRRRGAAILLSAVGLAGLTAFGAAPVRAGVEDDLRTRGEAALVAAGYDDVTVVVQGRDVELRGEVAGAEDVARARELVLAESGVRVVRTDLVTRDPIGGPALGSRVDPDELEDGVADVPPGWFDGDGDGMPDGLVDADADGIPDVLADTDGDGVPDLLLDADGDGVPDGLAGLADDAAPVAIGAVAPRAVGVVLRDGGVLAAAGDADGDGVLDVLADADGDGVPDTLRDVDGDGVADILVDRDRDGVPDVLADRDGDGLVDLYVDADGDGIPDIFGDADGDGRPDGLADADGDGVPDGLAPIFANTGADGDTADEESQDGDAARDRATDAGWIDLGDVRVLGTVQFATLSTRIDDRGIAVVLSAVAQLEQLGVDDTVVIGHADTVGPEGPNQRLSRRRAEAVAEVLNEVRPDLLIRLWGRGEDAPLSTDEASRRVEILVVND